ncbi:McrC family protein [Dehalobacter sp. DCM]|uniref:McrC family protein n=1 Tax=Dehalobacter sp. DCM TaxID=2907827 RepID=UPI0030817EDB|nr:McrC family protein [Dehalobacter sp. DCM]
MNSTNLIKLTEWSEQLLDGVFFKDDIDRKVAQKLAESGILEILEMRSGILIKSNSYVGRVSLGNLHIQIIPKLHGMPLITLLQYTYGIRNLKLLHYAGFKIDHLNFFDLLIYTLYSYAEDLFNRGLIKGYTGFEKELACVKGRIDISHIANRGGIITATLPCKYYERNENTQLNQVLLAGLRLAGNLASDNNLRHNVMRLCDQLSAFTEYIKLNKSVLIMAQRSISRLTDMYEPSLELINILYESQCAQIEDWAEQISLPGYFFDMNLFFEALVSKLLKNLGDEYSVVDQYRLGMFFAYEPKRNPKGKRSPTPRPDFALLKNGLVEQLLDSKYRDLWDRNLPRDMLYQLAVYAVSGVGNQSATILYPAMNGLPVPQQINVYNPLSNGIMAKVFIKPIDLIKVAGFIERGENNGLSGYFTEVICYK